MNDAVVPSRRNKCCAVSSADQSCLKLTVKSHSISHEIQRNQKPHETFASNAIICDLQHHKCRGIKELKGGIRSTRGGGVWRGIPPMHMFSLSLFSRRMNSTPYFEEKTLFLQQPTKKKLSFYRILEPELPRYILDRRPPGPARAPKSLTAVSDPALPTLLLALCG